VSKVTRLAEGQIINVELVSDSVIIRWPSEPTITRPTSYDNVASDAMRTLANATVELARLKARRKL
jgi:hypothetical protein